MDDFKELSLLTEHVIDKRGFFYHGDEMPPEKFVRTLASGKYANTSSMYGVGMYCVRHPMDAAQNDYGPYVYKLYVRGLDNFLHLDELPYNSVFGKKGTKDSEDYEEYLGPTYGGKATGDFNPSFRRKAEGDDYSRFVLQQFERLARVPVTPGDLKEISQALCALSEGDVEHSAELLNRISHLCERYGIAGVTYTGSHDRRCALVYDLNNVFPVGWALQERDGYGEKHLTPFQKIDYRSDKFSDSRSFISKYGGEKNIQPTRRDASRESNVRLLGALVKVVAGNLPEQEKTNLLYRLILSFVENRTRLNDAMYYNGQETKAREFKVVKMLLSGDVEGIVEEMMEHTKRHFLKTAFTHDDEYSIGKIERLLQGALDRTGSSMLTRGEQAFKSIRSDAAYVGVVSKGLVGFDPQKFYYLLHITDMGGGIFKTLEKVFYLCLPFMDEPEGEGFYREGESLPFNERRRHFDSSIERAKLSFEVWRKEGWDEMQYTADPFERMLLAPYAKMYETALKVVRRFESVARDMMAHSLKKNTGGGGAPGSTAAEPQTQMESFSGFVGHSVTPGVVSPVPRKTLHGF